MKLLKLLRERQAKLCYKDKEFIGIIALNKYDVSRILSGKRKVSMKYLGQVSLFLDLSINETLTLIKEQ